VMADEKEKQVRGDAVMVAFIKDPEAHKSDIGQHLQACSSLRRMPNTGRGMTCDHGFHWGLNGAEMAKIM
jgi:hypothetical protein